VSKREGLPRDSPGYQHSLLSIEYSLEADTAGTLTGDFDGDGVGKVAILSCMTSQLKVSGQVSIKKYIYT
jgi:hypothetical protein